MSRARDAQGQGAVGYLLSPHLRQAPATAVEYARRFGCEQGFRAAQGELGFAPVPIPNIPAWSRRFALFALALWVEVSVAVKLGVAGALQ